MNVIEKELNMKKIQDVYPGEVFRDPDDNSYYIKLNISDKIAKIINEHRSGIFCMDIDGNVRYYADKEDFVDIETEVEVVEGAFVIGCSGDKPDV